MFIAYVVMIQNDEYTTPQVCFGFGGGVQHNTKQSKMLNNSLTGWWKKAIIVKTISLLKLRESKGETR